MKLKKIKKKLKDYENLTLIIGFCILCITNIIYVWLIYSTDGNTGQFKFNSMKTSGDIKIDFGNLTKGQIFEAKAMISDVKPVFWTNVYNIQYVHEGSLSDRAVGQNFGGTIYLVWFPDDEQYNREILCHEILHSMIMLPKQAEEVVAYDLDSKELCYEHVKFN